MKLLIEVCVVASVVICPVCGQESQNRSLQKGISVQMPVASNAEEMRAADEPNASVVAITAAGKVFSGIQPIEPGALSRLNAGTVYVKADARVSFQTVLAVLNALRGKSVVMLAAAPVNGNGARARSPYGIKLIVPR